MSDENIHIVLKSFKDSSISLEKDSDIPSNIGRKDFLEIIEYLEKREFISETEIMNQYKITNIGSDKLRELDLNKEKKESRQKKSDKLLDLDLKLRSFESKIGKKLIIAGFIITFLSFLTTVLTLKFWDTDLNINEQTEKTEFKEKQIITRTEFKSGRWISTTDSLAGIEIKNDKWIMFYKGMETDSTDIYDIKIRREYFKELGTEHKPIEYLTLTNESDTLDYSILEYSKGLLSLSYIPRGNTLNYRPEK